MIICSSSTLRTHSSLRTDVPPRSKYSHPIILIKDPVDLRVQGLNTQPAGGAELLVSPETKPSEGIQPYEGSRHSPKDNHPQSNGHDKSHTEDKYSTDSTVGPGTAQADLVCIPRLEPPSEGQTNVAQGHFSPGSSTDKTVGLDLPQGLINGYRSLEVPTPRQRWDLAGRGWANSGPAVTTAGLTPVRRHPSMGSAEGWHGKGIQGTGVAVRSEGNSRVKGVVGNNSIVTKRKDAHIGPLSGYHRDGLLAPLPNPDTQGGL